MGIHIRVSPSRKRSLYGRTKNILLTKLVLSRWLDVGLCTLGQYSAIFTWSKMHIKIV